MNTHAQQAFFARMAEDAEPVVETRKVLVAPPAEDDPDQRGLYQVQVTVKVP